MVQLEGREWMLTLHYTFASAYKYNMLSCQWYAPLCLCRLASERAADHTAIQSLKQALHESSLVSADEARSRDVSIRSELRQRQQALLTDMSALASEVDGYRWVVMMTHVHQFILSFCFTSYIPGSSY